jgi:hypothetical protein
MQEMTQDQIAERMYIAFCAASQWRDAENGKKLPPYSDVQNTAKFPWRAAAQVAIEVQDDLQSRGNPRPIPIGTKQHVGEVRDVLKEEPDHRHDKANDEPANAPVTESKKANHK